MACRTSGSQVFCAVMFRFSADLTITPLMALGICGNAADVPQADAQERFRLARGRDGVSLPAGQTAGQHTQDDLQRGGVNHEPDLISGLARRMSADLWSTTRPSAPAIAARWTAQLLQAGGVIKRPSLRLSDGTKRR
jgi:hypothetical protein